MLGGHNNPLLPAFLDENRLQCQVNQTDQLQVLGNLPAGCAVDSVNYFGNEHHFPMIRPTKRGREMDDIERQQNLQIALKYNTCQEEGNRSTSIPNNNYVSTGLRLSYDDDERNSSVTSASGSMTVAPSIVLSLGDDNMRNLLEQQKEEFDQYIRTQEEYLVMVAKNMKQKHTASFLAAVEKGLSKKLREKDLEIDNINRKNRELVEKIKLVASENQNWQLKAKYNESVVNLLKSNLQQVISQGAEQVKEGFGDSELDDTASYINPTNYLSVVPASSGRNCGSWKPEGGRGQMRCKACMAKEVAMLVMPCRHLCLCKECDVFIGVCPVCRLVKTASVQVFLS